MSSIAAFEKAAVDAAIMATSETSSAAVEAAMRAHASQWREMYEAARHWADKRRLVAIRDVFHFPNDFLLKLRDYNESVTGGVALGDAIEDLLSRCDACGQRPACMKATLCAAAHAVEEEFVLNKGAPIGGYRPSYIASVREALRQKPEVQTGGAHVSADFLPLFKSQFRIFADASAKKAAAKKGKTPAYRTGIDEAAVSTQLSDLRAAAMRHSSVLDASVRRHKALRSQDMPDVTRRIVEFLRDAKAVQAALDRIATAPLDGVVDIQNATTTLEGLKLVDDFEELDGLIEADVSRRKRAADAAKADAVREAVKARGLKTGNVEDMELRLAANIIASEEVA